MTLNFVKIYFFSVGFIIVFFGLLINFFESKLPSFLSKLFRYGKFCSNIKHKCLDKLEVPKRWFKHFYNVAGPIFTVGLILIYHRYYQNGKMPDSLIRMLNFLVGQPIQSLIPVENTFVAITLLMIHCWKRFYEVHYVSIYSDTYMNFLLYLCGLFHYFGTIISILCESYDLTKDTKVDVNWTNLTYLEYTCIVVFLTSSYLQFKTNIILSNLRKDKKGVIVTKNYKIPQGGLFNWISAPLQFTEIIIYICLSIILRSASTFHFVTFWVIANQVESGYLSHEYYLRTFKNYPDRKVIVPLIF